MNVVFMLYVCCGLTSSHAGPMTQENSRLLDKLRVPCFVDRSDLFTRHFLKMSVAFSCRAYRSLETSLPEPQFHSIRNRFPVRFFQILAATAFFVMILHSVQSSPGTVGCVGLLRKTVCKSS